MLKFLKGLIKFIAIVVGALYAVYFWNLDQKLMGWAYTMVNRIFDRKKVDIKF